MRHICYLNFYLTDDWCDVLSNRICLYSLKTYQDNFDEIVIFATVDKNVKSDTLVGFMKYVRDNIHVNHYVYEMSNDKTYQEAKQFKEYVLTEIFGMEDTVAFWAHNKGYTNMKVNWTNKESVAHWISGMWYFNNARIDVVDSLLSDDNHLSVGMFKIKLKGFTTNAWHYSGSMFWVNPTKLAQYAYEHKVLFPKMTNRFFVEKWLGNIFPEEYAGTLGAYYDGSDTKHRFDGYRRDYKNWLECVPSEYVGDYEKFHNEAINYKITK